ncbi:MAG: methyltransferase domain-containing protein [Desulfobulbaceae bacterium]|nr:methyltransferase domain-containing protein [Desulfobulbaceae bacterium]
MKQNLTEHFDQAAANWDKKQRRVRLAHDISTAIGRLPLNQEMTAMDYGCGTGLVGLALAPKLKWLTGVDTSEAMLSVLAEKGAKLSKNNVSTRLLDLALASSPEQFDLVICSMALHHIENMDKVLANFFAALNPDGYLAVADLDEEDGSFHEQDAGEKHNGFDRQKLQRKLADIGFRDIHFQTVHAIDKSIDGEQKSFPIFLVTARKS